MSEYEDDFCGHDLDVHGEAAERLIQAHPAEYKQHLAEVQHEAEVRELKAKIEELERTIKDLRELNPDGVNVPAIQETVNILGEKVTELQRPKRRKT